MSLPDSSCLTCGVLTCLPWWNCIHAFSDSALGSNVLGERSQREPQLIPSSCIWLLCAPRESGGVLILGALLPFSTLCQWWFKGLGILALFLPVPTVVGGMCQVHSDCNYLTNCIMVCYFHEICSNAAFLLRNTFPIEEIKVSKGMDELLLAICKTASVLKLSGHSKALWYFEDFKNVILKV